MTVIINEKCNPVNLDVISNKRRAITKILKERGVNQKVLNNIALCFSEAASNIIKYSIPSPSELKIIFEYKDNHFYLHLFDDGKYWDPTSVSAIGSLNTFEEKETGRGLALIFSLTDDVKYSANKMTKENCLSLSWEIQQSAHKASVLIVEDDDSQRRLINAYLMHDFHVYEASNGEEALSFLKHNTIDLVISDIRMPSMNGLDLKKSLHKEGNTLLTPFIFLTHLDNKEIRNNAMGLGIDDYLLKPVTKKQLLNSAQRVLRRSEQIYRQLTDKINQRITQALTPRLPKNIHSWALSVSSRNTGIGGGDLILYRDFDEAIMINLLDIMGHDVSAKFFSYAYGGYLRGLMFHIDSKKDPCATLLHQLSNCAMDDRLLSQVILTCFSVMLHPNGKIEMANAGHPLAIKVTPTSCNFINVSGALAGVLYNTDYQSLSFIIKKSERIALYTDGLFEAAESADARKALETAVMQRLKDTLSLPLNEANEKVMAKFDTIGNYQRDDATLILLEWNGD